MPALRHAERKEPLTSRKLPPRLASVILLWGCIRSMNYRCVERYAKSCYSTLVNKQIDVIHSILCYKGN